MQLCFCSVEGLEGLFCEIFVIWSSLCRRLSYRIIKRSPSKRLTNTQFLCSYGNPWSLPSPSLLLPVTIQSHFDSRVQLNNTTCALVLGPEAPIITGDRHIPNTRILEPHPIHVPVVAVERAGVARFDAEPVLETRVLGVEALPFVLGFRAVDLEGAELLAVRAILGPCRELEEEKTEWVSFGFTMSVNGGGGGERVREGWW